MEWATPAGEASPSIAARRALAAWAEARGLRLTDPLDIPAPVLVPDAALADAVETDLDHAHDAITAEDARGADAALDSAAATLERHPELPQASWLLAEVLRARATRLSRLSPRDAEGSRATWARAAALDGGRARGVGEGVASAALPLDEGPGSLAHAPLAIEGAAPGTLVVALDGVVVHGAVLVAARGEHQLTVARAEDGALLWAAWVTLDGANVIDVTLPRRARCSREDLSQSRVSHDAVAASGVACGDWVFVEESARVPGQLTLATCSGDACGPLVKWTVGPLGPVLLPDARRGAAWPAWATWTLVAASAAVATGATLAASGVFRPTHDQAVFTTGGLHVSSSTLSRLRLGD